MEVELGSETEERRRAVQREREGEVKLQHLLGSLLRLCLGCVVDSSMASLSFERSREPWGAP